MSQPIKGFRVRRSKWLPVLIFLLVVSSIAAYPARGQVKGAVILSHDYDAAKNMVTLHMLNQSGKDITAYDIAVTETYPGKAPHTHWVGSEMVGVFLSIADPTDIHHQDLVESLSHGDSFQAGPNGTWQAGTTHDDLVGVAPHGVTNFEATIDTVIYADRTAAQTPT